MTTTPSGLYLRTVLTVILCGYLVNAQIPGPAPVTRCSTLLRTGGYCVDRVQGCTPNSYEFQPFSNLLGCSRPSEICCTYFTSPPGEQINPQAPIAPTPPRNCGRGSGLLNSRILGGKFTQPCDWPFVVSIRARKIGATVLSYGESVHACSGVLVADNWVLTTPFCLLSAGTSETEAPNNILVVAGEYNVTGIDLDPLTGRQQEQLSTVERAVIYPAYAYRSRDELGSLSDTLKVNSHAIALLKLGQSINGKCSGVACLPTTAEVNNACAAYDNCVITGWGFTTEKFTVKLTDTLRSGRNRLSSREACDFLSKRLGLKTSRPAGTTCQGMPRGAPSSVTDGCMGDEGGPVLCNSNGRNWVVRGLLPFNFCVNNQYNIFVTDVAPYSEWISQIIATY